MMFLRMSQLCGGRFRGQSAVKGGLRIKTFCAGTLAKYASVPRSERCHALLVAQQTAEEDYSHCVVPSLARMVVKHKVNGYEEFTKLAESLESSGEAVHILFSGSKDENGDSWCPYCVKAAPVVTKALESAPEKSHFILVEIERPFWKDQNCPFRKDPRTHLVFLPTLLRWRSPQRLDGSQCANEDLVEMLFQDED